MGRQMLQFTQLKIRTPTRRDVDTRNRDFDEIYSPYTSEQLAAQASRCSQCGVPFCQQGCPLSNNIPDWLKLAAEGRMQEAWRLSSATNNMPEICGRICPQDRLCEGICTIEQSGHGTVTIGAIEKSITDNAWAQGWITPIKPRIEREQGIGIIGAGPAGLAAAEQLRRQGYSVTVYDCHDRAGGLLTYGIPGFKLEKHLVTRRRNHLADSGIRFELNTRIGSDIGFNELRTMHDAVLIATGVYQAVELQVPGVGSQGVVAALDYLIASNRKGFSEQVPEFDNGNLDARGKRVVVIGGGDTAMDCLRTAVRQGASSVHCLYRRDQANMPGSQREVDNAMEEGVRFEWLSAPEAILSDDENCVSGVRVATMKLGPVDESGRQRPEKSGDQHTIEADMVIKALGFDPEDLPTLWDEPELRVNQKGVVSIDWDTMMTSQPGVFAAGDIVRGASLVVWAILDGRNAAAAMHRYLSAMPMQELAHG